MKKAVCVPQAAALWNVVNVEYRLARVSLAPASVEDCLCALRWVKHNAKEYNVDTNRMVVTGNSAGGHLALTTRMIPASAGPDRQCPGPEELKVGAIVRLITVPGGRHGNFKPEEYPRLYREIREFLAKYNLLQHGGQS